MPVFATDTPIDNVSEFRQKKALVEKLRKREQALAALGENPTTVSAAASGAFPGMTKANYGGMLTNAAKTYMQLSAGEEAAAQEQEMQRARSDALKNISPEAMDKLTPQQLIQMQDMGIDVGALKAFQPKKEPLANLLQNIDSLTEASADVLAPQYGMDVEQLRGMIREAKMRKSMEAEEAHKREIALRQLGIKEPKPSEFELYLQDPEKYKEFMAAKQGGAKSGGSEFTKALEKQVGKDVAASLNQSAALDVKNEQGEGFKETLRQRVKSGKQLGGGLTKAADFVGDLAGATGEFKPSNFDPQLSLRSQQAAQYRVDAAEKLRGQGQITEGERKMIEETQFFPSDTDEVILKKLEQIDQWMEQAREKVARAKAAAASGDILDVTRPSKGAGAPASGGWSIKQVR